MIFDSVVCRSQGARNRVDDVDPLWGMECLKPKETSPRW